MVELIDDFFAEYPAAAGGSDKVDTDEADEVIDAIAKTVAELTERSRWCDRQQLLEQLTHEIMNYDAEFRRETLQVQLGLMRGTEKGLPPPFSAASLLRGMDPPPCWTGRGWSCAQEEDPLGNI